MWQNSATADNLEFDLSKREYLFRKPMGSESVDPEALSHSPVLQQWINPYYLDPGVMAAKRAAVRAMPLARYAVLDDFFSPKHSTN